MKKILLLLANGFEIYEASVFIDVFGWNRTEGDGSTVLYTCGLNKELHAAFGLSINTDFMIQDICVNEYEALAIPGGFEEYGFYEDAYNEDFLQLIRDFTDNIITSWNPSTALDVAFLLLEKNYITRAV